MSDNGTEFNNETFAKVAKKLGVEHKIFSPPFHPQSNGRIEGFHQFLKACLAKHVTKFKQWDEVIPIACAVHIISSQMNIPKKVLSFLCMEEIQEFL